jgi:DeoR/GlpR family transcriptional regulator of sugar metabolism
MDILKKNSFSTVASLAAELYASLPTIRRDLAILESDGYVKRCHGGAMILDGSTNPPLYFRREHKAQEKIRMCKLAATLISEGETLFLDGSTSVYHLADHLDKDKNITVITNGLPLATALAETGIKIYSTGGKLMKESLAFVGISAEKTVRGYNADTLFFSVASLSDDGVLSDWSEEEAMLRVEMSKCASKRVLLCDSSKLSKSSTFKLFSLSSVEFIITDNKLPDGLISGFDLQELTSSPAYLYSVQKRKN